MKKWLYLVPFLYINACFGGYRTNYLTVISTQNEAMHITRTGFGANVNGLINFYTNTGGSDSLANSFGYHNTSGVGIGIDDASGNPQWRMAREFFFPDRLAMRIYNLAGTGYNGLISSSAATALNLVLPYQDGSDGQFMKTDGSGNLAFSTIYANDSRSGSNYPTYFGSSAFPDAPASTYSGIALDGMRDSLCSGEIKAGLQSELGYIMNVGGNIFGMTNSLNTCVQGAYHRFNFASGEPPLSLAIKDNQSLVTGGDLSVFQASEYGTFNIGRGFTIPDNSHNAEVEIRPYDANTIPLLISNPPGSSVDLTEWSNGGSVVADVSKNGDFETTGSVSATGSVLSTTGGFFGPDGTSGAPGYAFFNESSAGMKRSGSRNVGLYSGNRLKFEVCTSSVHIPSPYTFYANAGIVASSATIRATIPTLTFDDTGGVVVRDFSIGVDEGSFKINDLTSSKSVVSIDANGNMGIGPATNPDAASHVTIVASDGTYSHLYLTPGSFKSSLKNGQISFDSASNNLVGGVGSVISRGDWTISVATQTSTITNSNVETSLWKNVMSDTTTVLANGMTAFKTYNVEAWGRFSTDAVTAPQLQFKINFGTITVLDSGLFTVNTAMTDEMWRLEGMVTVRTSGTGGRVMGQGLVTIFDSSSGNIFKAAQMKNTTTIIVPTNAARVIDLTGTWDNADTDNTLNMDLAEIKQTH